MALVCILQGSPWISHVILNMLGCKQIHFSLNVSLCENADSVGVLGEMWAKWRLDLSSPSERFAPRKKDAAAASRCRAMRRSRPRGGNEEDVGVCGDNVEGR